MSAIMFAGRPALNAVCRLPSASALLQATAIAPQSFKASSWSFKDAVECDVTQLGEQVSTATIGLRCPGTALLLPPASSFPHDLRENYPLSYGTLPDTFVGRGVSASLQGPCGTSTASQHQPLPASCPAAAAATALRSSFLPPAPQQHSSSQHPSPKAAPHLPACALLSAAPTPHPLRSSTLEGHPTAAGSPRKLPYRSSPALTSAAVSSALSLPVRRSLHSSTARGGGDAAEPPATAAGPPGTNGAAAPPAARDPAQIRNFAIIAHIDHGKTTLMDRLLASCGHVTGEDRAMDSHSLERERGITILAKVTSFTWRGFHINAVDTPGHADFGGEVERVLGLVDGCVLLVDAAEGPLAQTKYVVAKALERGLRPVVVLNKVDRPAASPERCAAVANSLLDLFVSLGASDEQLDFPLLYASAKQGWASRSLPAGLVGGSAASGHDATTAESAAAAAAAEAAAVLQGGMAPLLDTLVGHVPAPAAATDLEGPFRMRVAMIERDPYIGRIATGRIASGRVRIGDKVRVLSYQAGGPVGSEARVTRITKRAGMSKIPLEEAVAGDIVSIGGPGSPGIADTIASPEVTTPLDPGRIDPPTLAMVFGPNDSPLAGRAGRALTGRAIGERLQSEAETSVSLRVEPVPGGSERYEVQARGELQLGVLIESMRREGAELAVSPPQVLLREGEGGQLLEPLEEVVVEVADEVAGAVIEALSQRRAELVDMVPITETSKQRLTFTAPSRGLIGFKSMFVNMTRGEGIMTRVFQRYAPHRGPLAGVRKGVMVSLGEGRATSYALGELQGRGTFFIAPGADVYGGMVVGEHNRDDDLDVNPVKEKKTSNVRSVTAEEKVQLAAPRVMTLEDAIGYVAADELIEVTPAAVRIRKEILDAGARRVLAKRRQQQQR